MAFTAVIAFAKQKGALIDAAAPAALEPVAASFGIDALEDGAASAMRLLITAPVPASAWLALGAMAGALFLGAFSARRA